MRSTIVFAPLLCLLIASCSQDPTNDADIILYHGQIVTMDPSKPTAQALAIKNDKIVALGSEKEIKKLAGDQTLQIDLAGKNVIPGLIDNHVHPLSAAESEYGKKLPHMVSIDELFAWIREESKSKKPGEWIVHPKFFFTRLKERRWPTIQELDELAPDNPVFLNGAYAGMVNTKALEVSDIVRLNEPAVVRDPQTQQPSGLIRAIGFKQLTANQTSHLSKEEQLDALKRLFAYYNAMGLTSICAGHGGTLDLDLVKELQKRGELSIRIFHNMTFPFDPKAPLPQIKEALGNLPYKTGEGDEWVKVGALKLFLDGGVLTGTAFMGRPWGENGRRLFGFPNPSYRGELNFSRQQLANVMTAAIEVGWKFTSHVTGEAGVDTLLAAYRDVDAVKPLRGGRHSIIHGNFFSPDAIAAMAEMDIYADVQPAWFFKDSEMLTDVLGADRMKDFHPFKTMTEAKLMLNGGSDHMVKLDPDEAINPYNPFQAMWTMITRESQSGKRSSPEQSVSREDALKMYTLNNAYASFEENEKGSLSVGKRADLVVLSEDFLTCHEDSIKSIRPLLTMVGGKVVYNDYFPLK
jgi:predicted amidohydrolase YtcJ